MPITMTVKKGGGSGNFKPGWSEATVTKAKYGSLEKLQEAFKEQKKLNNTKIITLEISDIIKDVLIYSSPEHFEEDKI